MQAAPERRTKQVEAEVEKNRQEELRKEEQERKRAQAKAAEEQEKRQVAEAVMRANGGQADKRMQKWCYHNELRWCEGSWRSHRQF